VPAGAGEKRVAAMHKPPFEETRESLEQRAEHTAHAIVALNLQVPARPSFCAPAHAKARVRIGRLRQAGNAAPSAPPGRGWRIEHSRSARPEQRGRQRVARPPLCALVRVGMHATDLLHVWETGEAG